LDGSKTYSPTFVWPDVGNKSTVQADFHPTLLGYINHGLQGTLILVSLSVRLFMTSVAENQVVTGNVAVTDATWTQNVADLHGLSSSLSCQCGRLRRVYRNLELGIVPEFQGAASVFPSF
jgi:hypothetical protein